MRKVLLAASAAFALALPASAQDEPDPRSSSEAIAPAKTPAPSPNQIVESASREEWVQIPTEDLLVMTLAPDAEGNEREVVIQLMPAPFSQGWVSNVRTLARAEWYDGITINRVQDNYVVQWGDPGHDNPESGETETKPLPDGLKVMGGEEYTSSFEALGMEAHIFPVTAIQRTSWLYEAAKRGFVPDKKTIEDAIARQRGDAYAYETMVFDGWAFGSGLSSNDTEVIWPVHCYGMVGVGRGYSPDTGSGAELYTVIGHAPRHLDRNIALVGRIIDGMEHLSSLPRGSGVLGFYTEEEADKRTPIISIRVASDLPEEGQPQFEYLSTESEIFAKYAEARANRRDPFFIVPAGGADICNIPVPIREIAVAEELAE